MPRTQNTTIDILKCIAAMLVYIMHVYIIYTQTLDMQILTMTWQFPLKTPAWAGVWIFMICGGYLAGTGFFSGRYGMTRKGILLYYKDRIKKIVIPTWLVIAMIYMFFLESLPSLKTVISFLLFSFKGIDSVNGIGSAWYVFTAMRLYLLTPFIVKGMMWFEKRNKGNEKKAYCVLAAIIVLVGLGYRLIGYCCGLDWYEWIYTNIFGNIDLFAVGIISNRIKFFSSAKNAAKLRKYMFLLLGELILMCSYFLFIGERPDSVEMFFLKYAAPSIFLINVAILLICSAQQNVSELTNKQKCISRTAEYSFQFYLWHSIVLVKLVQKALPAGVWGGYLITLFGGFILTAFVSILMTRAMKYSPKT